ncbi:MAG: FAD-dependent monooxygenase, partial [Rhodobacteraceae bacterium]|nr:FAD-dependent monooxygenase [Paracoccaceae bacterium]
TACLNGSDPCTIDCDYAVACDGYHGLGRRVIERMHGPGIEHSYPFGWLGVLSETPPVSDELIYASSARGFALASMRSPTLSRYYIQVPLAARPEDWSDSDFWTEFKARIPADHADSLITGPAIERSIAPLRSAISISLQSGHLLLCGDAGHIVPPTGAKGLNLAVSDVHYAHAALLARIRDNHHALLANYSTTALRRVWQVSRFSWWMTNLLHRIDGQSHFDRRMQESEFEHLCRNRSMQAVFAENYTGLPY